MKIGIICPASLPATQFGGILFLGVDLARELANEKHEVTIYTTDLDFANKYKLEVTPVILPNDKDSKKYKITNFTRMKSSLKFCVIAAGEFDFYAAEPRACEWDIAAGHAILEHAGGIITDFDGKEIIYGKKDFKNPSLILKRGNNL